MPPPHSANAAWAALATVVAASSTPVVGVPVPVSGPVGGVPPGVVPLGSLTHFCVVTSWDGYNATLDKYSKLLGLPVPDVGLAGGPESNGTYAGARLEGHTKIAFMAVNNLTRIEFLAGEPSKPSWWRDVYDKKGMEVHHMGYQVNEQIWPVVERFTAAGLGAAVQWARWGVLEQPGSGCYVYMNSQTTLGVTTEILANEHFCDSLPAPPATHPQ